jgi:hypothetical protein
LLKRVVVVVGNDIKEFFEGEDLQVIVLEHLSVQDGQIQLADFAHWVYWRKLE